MRGVAILAALGVAAVGAASPSTAADGWRTYRTSASCSVSVPAAWRLVPSSTAALKALASAAQSRHETQLANEYEVVLAERKAQPAFVFQAFQWPPPSGPIVPDVSVKIDPVSKATTVADLPAIAKSYAQALAKAPKVKVDPPVRLQLPAGTAMRLAGSTPLGKTGSARSAFTVYLLLRAKQLYSLSFRFAPASATDESPLFARIAARLSFD